MTSLFLAFFNSSNLFYITSEVELDVRVYYFFPLRRHAGLFPLPALSYPFSCTSSSSSRPKAWMWRQRASRERKCKAGDQKCANLKNRTEFCKTKMKKKSLLSLCRLFFFLFDMTIDFLACSVVIQRKFQFNFWQWWLWWSSEFSMKSLQRQHRVESCFLTVLKPSIEWVAERKKTKVTIR
jgi:hypothetical protein